MLSMVYHLVMMIKKTSKNIDKLNSDLNHAFDDIKNGYQNKDKKQLTKGQQALSKLNLNAKSW